MHFNIKDITNSGVIPEKYRGGFAVTSNNIEEKMLNDIVNELITERIAKEAKVCSEYMDFVKEQKKIEEVYRGLELSDEEKKLMQDYMNAMDESDIAYGHCVYKTGFLDCLVILKQLNLIGEE